MLSMPPAMTMSALPPPDRVRGHDRGLHARAAHLVDRGRLDMGAEAGLDRRLPRRGLAEAGGEDAAHVDLLDASGETPARSTAAPTAAAPSSVALAPERLPWKLPIGVRA